MEKTIIMGMHIHILGRIFVSWFVITQSKNGMKHQHLFMIIASIINLETSVKSWLKRRKTNFRVKDRSSFNPRSSLCYTRLDPSRPKGIKSCGTTSRRSFVQKSSNETRSSQPQITHFITKFQNFGTNSFEISSITKPLTNQSQKQPWNPQI